MSSDFAFTIEGQKYLESLSDGISDPVEKMRWTLLVNRLKADPRSERQGEWAAAILADLQEAKSIAAKTAARHSRPSPAQLETFKAEVLQAVREVVRKELARWDAKAGYRPLSGPPGEMQLAGDGHGTLRANSEGMDELPKIDATRAKGVEPVFFRPGEGLVAALARLHAEAEERGRSELPNDNAESWSGVEKMATAEPTDRVALRPFESIQAAQLAHRQAFEKRERTRERLEEIAKRASGEDILEKAERARRAAVDPLIEKLNGERIPGSDHGALRCTLCGQAFYALQFGPLQRPFAQLERHAYDVHGDGRPDLVDTTTTNSVHGGTNHSVCVAPDFGVSLN
jgi:hypothetical protein